MNFLVIDDDEMSLLISSRIIMHTFPEATVYTAVDGRDAVRQIMDGTMPDYVVLDVNMPEMDGFQFLEWHHTNEFRGKYKIIVHSSSLHPRDYQKSISFQDVIEYLEKPLKVSTLFHTINRFESTRAEQES